ncbi:MAG: hypothetical protein E6J14_14070 [Chloroflexi bacterium]|nr:MAG: hypothetical protein E6J14_14070 [Chloroflexota bacterium]
MAGTASTTAVSVARRLWDVSEPIAGSVYFAPEVQQRYEALGLSYPEGYFWSRSAAMGTLTPSAVSATFAVFNPDIVRPLLSAAQAKADRETVLEARRRGMGEALRRMLGDLDVRPAADALRPVAEAGEPHGRPLYAGLRDLPWPDDAHQALFFACDLVREYRSDGHVAVWTSLGWHPIEVMALTELFWGMSIGTHMRTRVWPHERVGEVVADLRARGLIEDDDRLTAEGLGLRRDIEERTDAAMGAMVDAAEREGAERVLGLVRPLARRVLEAGGYPIDPETQRGLNR